MSEHTLSDTTSKDLIERGFSRACGAQEVPAVMPVKVSIDGRSILVCRGEDGFFAVDELCPHKMESMAYGVVHGGRIICPHHQNSFDLQTGVCNIRRCAPLQTYPVELSDEGDVFVKALATRE